MIKEEIDAYLDLLLEEGSDALSTSSSRRAIEDDDGEAREHGREAREYRD